MPGGGTEGLRDGGGLHGRLAASIRAAARWLPAMPRLAGIAEDGIAEVLGLEDLGAYPLAG